MQHFLARARASLFSYALRQEIALQGAAFTVALVLSCTANRVSPLGAGFVAGVWMGANPIAAFMGAALGALLFSGKAALGALGIYAALGGLMQLIRGRLSPLDKLILVCCAQMICIPLFFLSSFETFLQGLANMSLCVCAAVAFRGAIRGVMKLVRQDTAYPTEAEQLCLCLSAAMVTYSLSALSIGVFYFSDMFACLFLLLCAGAVGADAMVAAVLVGAASALGGARDISCMSLYCACALCAAVARRGGKYALCGGYFLCALIINRFLLPDSSMLLAQAVGCALYLVIPKPWLSRLVCNIVQNELQKMRSRQQALQERTLAAADMLGYMAPLFSDGFASRQASAFANAFKNIFSESEREFPNFEVQVGTASRPKQGSRQSGDSMAVRRIRGKVLLLLSDGMGSGSDAHRESAAAIEMLCRLLSAGLELPDALESLNRLLITRDAERDMFTTLDVMLVDLQDASAQFIKYGAPPSCILRDGRVYTLYAEALPAGIIEQARPALHTATLRRGDAAVLMTDGTFEALGSELVAAIVERVGGANTPQDAAEALLSYAREFSTADDMSVIVARIC